MSKLGGLLAGAIFGGAFLYGQGMGIYHSFDKHDGYMSIYLPPYAWYRSLEYWWHDDFSGVDWPERVASDGRDAIILINGYSGSTAENVGDISIALEKFSIKISAYPEDKSKEIYETTGIYIEYWGSMFDEFAMMILRFRNGEKVELSLSQKTLSLERDIGARTRSNEILTARTAITEIFENKTKGVDSTKMSDTKKQELDQLVSTMRAAAKVERERMLDAQRKIFHLSDTAKTPE